MIGLVLVTHGRLADEFRHAVEHVVGPQDAFETISIGPEDDMEQRRVDIVEAVARAERGAGVIILTDMFGGTPSNLAISVMDGNRVDVLAGELPARTTYVVVVRPTRLQSASSRVHDLVRA